MHNTNMDCLTKITPDYYCDRQRSNMTWQDELEDQLSRIGSKTYDTHCRLSGSWTSHSTSSLVCVMSLARCGGQQPSVLYSNVISDMVRRYESLVAVHFPCTQP